MNFFKKFFGGNEKKEVPISSVPSTTQSIMTLTELLQPLIRPATKLSLQKLTLPPREASLSSYFGGQPYFEKGDAWPRSSKGRYLPFIFQVLNGPGIELPGNIQLIQFYYDFEEEPWQTESDGWLVKIYEKLNTDNQEPIKAPDQEHVVAQCTIKFETVASLPNWEGIDAFSKEAADLSTALNAEEPWQPYDSVVEKLIGKQDYQSQLGGYPMWLQGEETPQNNKGENMQLLFQIDSEEAAGLIWGDAGLVYVFYDTTTKQVAFLLQCH